MTAGSATQADMKYKLDEILQEVRHSTLEREIQDLKKRVLQMEREKEENKAVQKCPIEDRSTPGDSGVIYYRWGRTSCPENGTVMVYSGFAAGGDYQHSGASPEMLCLPPDPEWGRYSAGHDTYSNIVYSAEYELPTSRDNAIFGKPLHQQDVPCAVCEARSRKSHLMIPGRKTCYDGWSREYWGYLMSSRYSHQQQMSFYCVDADPEVLRGGDANTNGYILYVVEIRLGKGGTIFPPYVDGRELTCVVCTK